MFRLERDYILNVRFVLSKSNPKQPAVKKVCGPQKGYGEKDVKSKVAAKKWL